MRMVSMRWAEERVLLITIRITIPLHANEPKAKHNQEKQSS